MNELVSLDLRHAGVGFDRRCGDLFTVGLRGYESSYGTTIRLQAGEFRNLLLRSAWLYLRDGFPGENDGELPYVREPVWHQGRLLIHAMQGDHIDDFQVSAP